VGQQIQCKDDDAERKDKSVDDEEEGIEGRSKVTMMMMEQRR